MNRPPSEAAFAPESQVFEARFDSEAGFRAGVDQVLAQAGRHLRVFERDLRRLALEAPPRAASLEAFLRASPQNRLALVLHDAGPLSREMPRLNALLGRFGPQMEVRQTPETLRHLGDVLVLADDAHGVIRFHIDQARGKILLHQTAALVAYRQRFDELWECATPCAMGTVLGL